MTRGSLTPLTPGGGGRFEGVPNHRDTGITHACAYYTLSLYHIDGTFRVQYL